jgi:dual specificity tyrosine-phosphorylation-regulated kinase 2/3/4
LKILQYLKENDPDDTMNIIHMKDYVIFRKHLCISFELMSINLYEFLKLNDFEGLSLGLVRRFAIQLLYALKYLRENDVIHCDLKPENILLKDPTKSGIKIIDFGSSCFQDERVYTYIQSRFYRAPEIILGIPYTPSIDMWSFGCIMAEFCIGFPLFPGEDETDQLGLIMEVRGVPHSDVLKVSQRKKKFFTDDNIPISVPNSRGKVKKPSTKTIDEILESEDPNFVDFVEVMTFIHEFRNVWIGILNPG